MRNDAGRAVPVQPAFYGNYFSLITPAVTTTVNVLACAVTSVGTLSHPTVVTGIGYMTNFASAASLNATAGTGNNAAAFLASDGFYCAQRVYLPDASYNESGATTGARLFAGLTSGSLAASVASDNPAGDFAGFVRFHTNAGLQQTNWHFATKDNATLNLIDTGMVFNPMHVYDIFIHGAPGGAITWQIDDVTASTTATGATSTNLPTPTTLLRPGCQVMTVNATARNIRMQRIYCEAF
jgi:hypothetical protein